MSSKYILKLSSKRNISVDLGSIQLRYGLAGLLDFLRLATSVFWPVFVLLLGVSGLYYNVDDPGLGIILWVYAFVVILLFIQICKRILGSTNYLPSVSYDLLLLFFTSIAVISIFISLLSSSLGFSIWGHKELREISCLSIIAYWFLYYVINATHLDLAKLMRSVTYLSLAPVLVAVVNFISGNSLVYSIDDLMILTAPVWMVMFLSHDKNKLLYLANLLLSLLALVNSSFLTAVMGMWVSLVVLFVLTLLRNRHQLPELFKDLNKGIDGVIDRKTGIAKMITENSQALILFFSLLFAVVAGIWIRLNSQVGIFYNLENGVGSVNFSGGIVKALFGNGLVQLNATALTTFVNDYGLVSTLLFIVFLAVVVRNLIKEILKDKEQTPLFYFSLLSIIAVIVYATLGQVSEITLLFFWFAASFAGVLKAVVVDKIKLKEDMEVTEFSRFASKFSRNGLQLLQLLMVVLVLMLILYFLVLLSSISKFIS